LLRAPRKRFCSQRLHSARFFGSNGGRIDDKTKKAIVKIHAIIAPPDRIQPWQHNNQRQCTGSGFIIEGRRVLTNAHIVADHAFVTITKYNCGNHYPAKVVHVGHECDLALLELADDSFWDEEEEIQPLELSEEPDLQDTVTVVGYPTGGETISVTEGVVSRIELIPYAHGASKLLGIQIDAAINPGNSGGPALKQGQCIGIAFQNMPDAENVGYIIPHSIITHFLQDIERFGGYTGFCGLGIHAQPLPDTGSIQKFLGMRPEHAGRGVMVSKVAAETPAAETLKAKDVILACDGRPVNKDLTTTFRNRTGERIAWEHYIQTKFAGEKIHFDVWREGEQISCETHVRPIKLTVPTFQYDVPSSYYIYAGLVFTPLTQPYLHTWGNDWFHAAPPRLLRKALEGEFQNSERLEYVVLSSVLPNKSNMGANRLANLLVDKVGDVDVKSLRHLKEIVERRVAAGETLIDFYLAPDAQRLLVIDVADAAETHDAVLKRHRIPAYQSSDLDAEV